MSVVPMNTPVPPPETDWSGNLRDVIDTQQQTIKFLLGQWDALMKQVGIAGGDFGDPQVYNVGQLIPNGWWITLAPNDPAQVIATVAVEAVTIDIYGGMFWSNGQVTVSFAAGVTVARVAVMEGEPSA